MLLLRVCPQFVPSLSPVCPQFVPSLSPVCPQSVPSLSPVRTNPRGKCKNYIDGLACNELVNIRTYGQGERKK